MVKNEIRVGVGNRMRKKNLKAMNQAVQLVAWHQHECAHRVEKPKRLTGFRMHSDVDVDVARCFAPRVQYGCFVTNFAWNYFGDESALHLIHCHC